MSHRVLLLGNNAFPFANQLAEHLRRTGEFKLSAVDFLWGNAPESERNYDAFEKIYDPPEWDVHGSGSAAAFRGLGRLIRRHGVRKLFHGYCAAQFDKSTACGFRQYLRRSLGEQFTRERIAAYFQTLGKFDLLHVHSMFYDARRYLDTLPVGVPMVLSIWGSDLYQQRPEFYGEQLALCRRATAITVHSLEMKQVLLAKFGRRLEGKVHCLLFGHGFLSAIDEARPGNPRQQFCAEHNLDPSKTLICVAHNGALFHQHLQILESITRLPQKLRERITILLPMAYGADPPYMSTVCSLAAKTGVEWRILTEFLDRKKIAQLRLSCDILVHVPQTDAFSAAMCETLYAERILITGAWLPYARLRTAGVPFHEITDMAALTGMLEQVLSNLDQERARLPGTREKIRQLVAWENVLPDWINLFKRTIEP